jgi:ABC-type glycerol-3-phosphate transport system substrate-binding protein
MSGLAGRYRLHVRALYNDAMDPAVLSWDDAGNNQWLNSGKGSWIHNPISHYVVAKEKKMPVTDVTGFHPSPAGPAGCHTVGVPRSLGIWKFSKNVESAREFLHWFFEGPGPRMDRVGGELQPADVARHGKPSRLRHRSQV